MTNQKEHPVATIPAPPARSLAQRRAALDVANDVRARRCQLKREITASRARIGDVIVSPPVWAEGMDVYDLMVAMPRVGRVKTLKILNRLSISPAKTIGGLTPRQRIALAERLTPTSPSEPPRAMAAPLPVVAEPPIPKDPMRCTNCGEGPLRRKGLCGWCEPTTERSAA